MSKHESLQRILGVLVLLFCFHDTLHAQCDGKDNSQIEEGKTRDGYSVRPETVTCKGAHCFELYMHYAALYFKGRRLGRIGTYSVSPTGKYAAWEDGDGGGKILLFTRNTGKIRDITDGEFALPHDFTWHEDKAILELTYYPWEGHPDHAPSKISLEAPTSHESK